ncbi:MAG: glycosyltransferase family 87 protein [Pseudomonadota bacterium]
MPLKREQLLRTALSLWVVGIFGWWAAITFVINMLDQESFRIDFVAFWAAGKLAIAGEAMSVWDPTAFEVAQGTDPDAKLVLSWFYPATFHLLVTPFGLAPFSIAFGLWTLLTIGAFWRSIAKIAPTALPLIIMSPAIFLTVKLGNNAPLFAACLAFALHNLTRPAYSGSAIAMLSLKPGLGPMIAVAMIAGGRWRIVLWITVISLSLLVVSTGLFGFQYWIAFADNLEFAVERITPDARLTGQMTSWFALARYLSFDPTVAMLVHLSFFFVIAFLTLLMWRSSTADPNLRAAALAISVILSSPHAFHYEMVYALVAIGFLVRAGLGSVDRVVVALLWIGPLPGIWPIDLLPVCLFGAPMLTACFFYMSWKALRPRNVPGDHSREMAA